MSGGYFEYEQYKIQQIVDQVEQLTLKPGFSEYNDMVQSAFLKGLQTLKRAAIYAQRIDWLVSGDDSEETFLSRLREDLSKL